MLLYIIGFFKKVIKLFKLFCGGVVFFSVVKDRDIEGLIKFVFFI